MAASIVGTFTIIDRASAPMRRMEAQAKKTMAAIEALGQANDKATGKKQAQAHEQQTRAMRNVERQAKSTSGGLKGLGRDIDVVDRRTRGLTDRVIRLGAVFASLRVLLRTGIFAGLAVGITTLVQAVGALGGGLVALIPKLADTVGLLAALPASVGAAVQGIGALTLALGGVGEALKAGLTLQQQGARAAQDVADRQRNAANSVRSAERQLFLSHRSVADAQKQLTEARREARRELIDMKFAAEGAVLGEQRAALSLREAREALARTSVDPGATHLEMQGARLSVREAQLAMRQSRVERQRALSDNRRAQREGVQGSDRMIQARRALEDAIYGQTEATRALADAQRAANRTMEEGSPAVDNFKQAMAQLSPEAQTFVRQIISMRPVLQSLRAEAGRDLFPALGRALTRSQRLLPTMRRGLRGAGRVIGQHAEGAAMDLTSPDRLRDVNALMTHQNRLLNIGGRSIRNLMMAALDLALAARPFTRWLFRTVEGWTEMWRAQAKAGRESGSTAAFLRRVRNSLEQLGRIVSNVWGAFKGVMNAARPLGDRLWDGAEKATEGWDKFLNSAKGSRKATDWFNKLYDPLHEIGQLTKELIRLWAKLVIDPSFTETIRVLRGAVPYLERLMLNLSGLGPTAAGTLTEIVRLLSNLPISPLEILLKALNTMLRLFNKLLENVPGLDYLFGAILAGALMSKAIRLTGRLAESWGGVYRHLRSILRLPSSLWAKLRGGGQHSPGTLADDVTPNAGKLGKLGRGIDKVMSQPVHVTNIPLLVKDVSGGGGGKDKGPKVPPVVTGPGKVATAGRAVLAAAGRAVPLIAAGGVIAYIASRNNHNRNTEGGAEIRRDAERGTHTSPKPVSWDRVPGSGTRVPEHLLRRPVEGAHLRDWGQQFGGVGRGADVTVRREAQRVEQIERDSQNKRRREGERHHDTVGRHERTHQRGLRGLVMSSADAILRGTGDRWLKTRKAIVSNARGAEREAGAAFDKLNQQALSNLTKMGYTRSEAQGLLRGTGQARARGAGGDATATAGLAFGGRVQKFAGGGRIAGAGLRDTVPIAPGNIAAPGELVVNRHTEQRVAQKYGVNLDAEVRGETRPHSAALRRAMSGNWIRSHAQGGRIVPVPGFPGESILSTLLPDLMRIINKYNVAVTDGYATGGHAPNSDHYWGGAVDLVPGAGGSWDLVDALARWAEPRQGAPISPFRWVGYTGDVNHGRGNHLHLSWLRNYAGGGLRGLGRVAGGDWKRLKAPGSEYGGVPGALSDAAMGAYARAFNKRGRSAGGGGVGDLGAGVHGTNQQMGRQMMLKMWAASQWPALKELWTRESGWNHLIANPSSGAYGIPQSLPASKMASAGADWRTNPKTQIAWGLRYIKDRYGSPAAALAFHNANNWYSQGGRVPDWGGWNARGGRFSVDRPTLFGAGEGGGIEDVTIKPRGKAGVRPASIQVRIDNIEFNREGDVRDAVKREFELLSEDLDLVAGDD